MGLMETLRNSTKYIIVLLIGSFGILWVLSDVGVTNLIGAGPRDLGSVNGDRISLEEYQQQVQYYTNMFSQQTGGSMDREMSAYYENQVWEDLVSARLVEQKMDELGITVSDEELLDMVYGPNPDPVIVQNFQDENGNIDRAALTQIMSDPNFSQQAIALDLQLRQKRRQQKLANFITAGLQVTPADVEDEYLKNNTFADISYVRFPFAQTAPGEITATEKELRDYYNKHRDNYKQQENYELRYVSFSTMPTKDDTLAIIKEVEDLKAEFAATESDSAFLARNGSVTRYSNAYISKSDLRDDYAPVLDVAVGEVTDPIVGGGRVTIVKKTDERGDEIKFVAFARELEALFGTINDANENAEDFRHYATVETNFEEEADRSGLTVQHSIATKGNAFISGLGMSQQVLNFLEKGKRNAISPVIELPNSFVVVQLTNKIKEGYRSFEDVKSQIETQVVLNKRKQQAAKKVESLFAANPTLEGLAAAGGQEVLTAESVRGNTSQISGAGREPELIGIVYKMKEGETSKVLTGNSAVYVIRVDKKSEASLSRLDDTTRKEIQEDMEEEMNQRFLGIWLEQLKKDAKIVDNRSRLLSS